MARKSTEIRQEQIKSAVLDIIYTDGLKKLSTRNLAEHVGMSEGAIFRHFKTKQSIITSIITDFQNEFITKLQKIANSPASPQERLNQLFCTTVTYLTENRGITMLLFSEATQNNDQKLKQKLQNIFNSQKNLVSKIILDGIVLGIWDSTIDVQQIAMIYMGIPVALNVELLLSNGQFHVDNFCERTMTILNKILKK